MRLRLTTSSAFFSAMATVMIAISVISLVAALSWINRPFAGFMIYDWPSVASMSKKEPAKKAGLEFGDRIVSYDGRQVKSGRDVVSALKDKQVGTPVAYLVESKGQVRPVTLPVTLFGIQDFLLVFFITYLGGLTLFGLGIVVYVLKPNMHSSWVFMAVCLSIGGYMVTSFDTQSSYWLQQFHVVALSFMPATVFHLTTIFPEKKLILSKSHFLEYVVYAPAAILALAWQVYFLTLPGVLESGSLSWISTYKWIGSLSRIFLVLCVTGAVFLLFHSIFKAPGIVARQRARMILFGISIAFWPSVVIMLLVFTMKLYFPWNFLVCFVIFFPASIAYSIVKHNLFDADTIIRRTVGYVLVTGVVVGAYAVVSLALNVVMGKYQAAQSQVFPILFTLGVILVFNPLRDRIQALVDRLFFRKEYDYGAVVDKVSRAITSLLDLGQVLGRLAQTFVEDMFVNTISIMLLNPATAQYKVYIAEGERKNEVEGKVFESSGPLMQAIEGQKREITRYDVLEDPKYKDVSKPCVADFESVHASLMVPLVFQDKVIGLLNFGEKKSGKPYNRQDIDLLHAVANQGAVAIENARLFQENLEKQRMEDELNIARDLQMSMLPASCPRISGFDIAAISTPAREVGGDFFDFIEMGQDRVGLIVGDVTGKSVSGALVMSASRSVFRMLSEEQLNVGEIMMRANRRMKKDIKSGMFVALLYAVLDSRSRMLYLCSAGQTQPVHFQAESGGAVLVQTEGDTFPIGILDEAEYKETCLQLATGDRCVFYTDGIVEATNEKGEMFGFERLVSVVQEARFMNADLLLKEILSRVNAFVGSAPQHDDLTAIVISVSQ